MPIPRSLVLVLGFVTLSALSSWGVGGEAVFVSEIMYHPPGTNSLEQWIELHNAGAVPVELGAWQVTQPVRFQFSPGTVLPAGGFLVVAADVATFRTGHPAVAQVVGGWQGALSHDGDEIRVEDDQGRVVDTIAYSSEGDWAERRIGAPDRLGRQGWVWYAEHAGLGKSLELVNPALPHAVGQNWAASAATGGTPGGPNSAARTNAAPLILDVGHFPIVPRSTQPVRVTARVLDEDSALPTVRLHWRVDGSPVFTETEMVDDGAHGDGVAGDGLYGALVPEHADHAIIEFYLTAQDQSNQVRTFPNVVASAGSRTANLLFQVDDGTYDGNQPLYRLIMAQAEYDYLANQIWAKEPSSDALCSGTFVSTDGILDGGTTTEFRYGCGFRNRGHGTRTAVPHNFHVAFPKDHPWKQRAGLSLNTHYTHSQQLGSAIFRRAGIPMAESRPVQLRVNGANLAKPGQEQFGSYAANEVIDGSLARRQFPEDPDGNLYRGIRDMIPGITAEADLAWHGPEYTAYTNAYAKENHAAVNDWSDLIRLIDVLNHAPDATYAEEIARVADPDQWMRYFAINTLLDNQENSLGIGSGDDFALYRGTRDPRFRLLAYDMDSVLGRGTRATTYADGLWRMTNVTVINRFMKRPEFAPLYYRHLRELAATTFAPGQMNPLLDHLLGAYVDPSVIANLKAFNESHVAYVRAQIPTALSVRHHLVLSNGYPRATGATVDLEGAGDAVTTRRVLVNGRDAVWTAWQAAWTISGVALHPGLNRILVQALGEGGAEIGRVFQDVWYEGGAGTVTGGSLTADTTWRAAAGPYRLTSGLTVAPGATLTIEPGATVYLESGVNLTIASGGRLIAEGTETAPVRFSRPPGQTATWGGIIVNGGAGTPETRLVHAHLEFNGTTAIHSAGGTVYLEGLTFGSTEHPYLSLDASSFVVRECTFPSPTAAFEPVHGTGGVKSGGHGIFVRNYFGLPIGYNDVVDFTGGNRPGQPIVHFINNVFSGASDDELDLDGTDAWIEGNIFLHTHKNGTPDSASAISGGSDGSRTSEVTIIGNLFYDCDQAVTAKQGNYYTLLGNTVVHQTRVGGLDTDGAVLNLADDGTTEGAGLYLEGNILYDAEKLLRNRTASPVTITNNLLPFAWNGDGGGNSDADPLFVHLPAMPETVFGTWKEAQVLRSWLSLRPGSPGRGRGPNHSDLGGVNAIGVSVSGEPEGTTRETTATLYVGTLRSGGSIPSAGFPGGSGYTHYRYRVDGGDWSGEFPIDRTIALTGLSAGPHRVEVSGKRDSGLYQDDPLFGPDARVTSSRTWIVDPAYVPSTKPAVVISEILASSPGANADGGDAVDWIELVNQGVSTVDLSGMGVSDTASVPYRFRFPAGTFLAPGAYLLLRGDADRADGGWHLGFGLDETGDSVTLTDRPGGGGVLDSVHFGHQIPGHTIGRRADESWGLCLPTPAAPNLAVATGDPFSLRLNEWLADARVASSTDFVELYNPSSHPVDLGGLHLSDAAGSLDRHAIAPLSFIDAGGFVSFIADGDPGQGANHLNFHLSPDVGVILLSSEDLKSIDAVNYGPQRTDVSEGRTPNGSDVISAFQQPTPGGPNPGTGGGSTTIQTVTVSLVPLNAAWRYQQTANLDGVNWTAAAFDDSGWPSGKGLLGVEESALPAPGLQTPLTLGRTTYYFRTRFVVETNLAGFHLNLTTVVDDGVILYLNGLRILTNGMSSGVAGYATQASRNVSNASTEFFSLPADALVEGTNVVAAEVHQTSSASTDVVWGLGLDAARTFTNTIPSEGLSVVLNEVTAAGETLVGAGDFVELWNASTQPVDLTGVSLTDDPGFARKWVFPAGSGMTGGGRLVIRCDPALPASATNTAFGLSAGGGAVYLFDSAARGGGLVDALRYGVQATGYSVGRIPDGVGAWSLTRMTPGEANSAVGLGSAANLRVNEWMADPATGDDWFEIFNGDALPVALGGMTLTDDLADPTRSVVPALSFVGGHGFVRFHADGNPGNGADHVGFSLRKAGEAIGIFSSGGVSLDAVTFGNQATGVSAGRFPDGAATFTSFPTTASPAESNYLPLGSVVVNEVLAHTDPPLEDAIELFNSGPAAVDLSGWYLSNSRNQLQKYRIPAGTVIPGRGFQVFYEAQFASGAGVSFVFNSAHGDSAILSQADAAGNLTGYRSEVHFGATANAVSVGRIPTSVGADFGALESRSFGQDLPTTVEQFRTGTGRPNAGPLVGPVVITEVLYRWLEGGVENGDGEFVELLNLTGTAVPLFRPERPADTWRLRDAVDFEFPTGITLGPGERVLVTGVDPADFPRLGAFRARFQVPADVRIFGPWTGRLGNAENSVELVRPDAVQLPPHPDAGFVPQLLVDRVHYSALVPWPSAAADGAHSLQRLGESAYGNDPANWQAAPPTAGRPAGGGGGDVDGDGLPDSWELAYFGTLARDGLGDYDSDGLTDRQEYLAGTSPVSSSDRLQLTVTVDGGAATLTFSAVAGRSYTVESQDDLSTSGWRRVADVPSRETGGTRSVLDLDPLGGSRFYRVVTPARP